MARLLHRLGMLCARRPLIVLGIWFVMLVLIIGAVRIVGSVTSNDLSLPGTGSQDAKDLLQEKFPPQQNGANPIVFDVSHGQADRPAVPEGDQRLRQGDQEAAPRLQRHQPAQQQRPDRRPAVQGQADGLRAGADGRRVERPHRRASPRTSWTPRAGPEGGHQVAAAGSIGSTLSTDESETSEIIGILVAMLILSLVLGSIVAMGMPIITAVAGARRRAGPGRAGRPRRRDPLQRADPGHDDRARRRHRLRAVPGHPTSRTAPRRHGHGRLHRQRRGHVRQRHRLRRRHRRDRPAVPGGGRHPPGHARWAWPPRSPSSRP